MIVLNWLKQGDDLNREMTMNALEKHKFLTLPQVNSCNMLDTLCQGGPNTRYSIPVYNIVNEGILYNYLDIFYSYLIFSIELKC